MTLRELIERLTELAEEFGDNLPVEVEIDYSAEDYRPVTGAAWHGQRIVVESSVT